MLLLLSAVSLQINNRFKQVAVYTAPVEVKKEAIKAPKQVVYVQKPLILTEEIKNAVSNRFGQNSGVLMAILAAESSLNPKAVNYNCRYDGKSRSCKVEDRHLAWSVDCGISQINVKGQVCPKELFDLQTNLNEAKKILATQGLNAWVVYSNGTYLKYMYLLAET